VNYGGVEEFQRSRDILRYDDELVDMEC